MESYPDGSPQGRAGRRPSSMARAAKHNSAHAPRSLEFLMFFQLRFFTHLPSFPALVIDLSKMGPNKKRGPEAAQFLEPIPLSHALEGT
jgi:hypothetical protein